METKMSSTNNRATVDEIINANGKYKITHIIEYKNIFDSATTYKLCEGKKMYEHAMKTGAFINPKLLWEKT